MRAECQLSWRLMQAGAGSSAEWSVLAWRLLYPVSGLLLVMLACTAAAMIVTSHNQTQASAGVWQGAALADGWLLKQGFGEAGSGHSGKELTLHACGKAPLELTCRLVLRCFWFCLDDAPECVGCCLGPGPSLTSMSCC